MCKMGIFGQSEICLRKWKEKNNMNIEINEKCLKITVMFKWIWRHPQSSHEYANGENEKKNSRQCQIKNETRFSWKK